MRLGGPNTRKNERGVFHWYSINSTTRKKKKKKKKSPKKETQVKEN